MDKVDKTVRLLEMGYINSGEERHRKRHRQKYELTTQHYDRPEYGGSAETTEMPIVASTRRPPAERVRRRTRPPTVFHQYDLYHDTVRVEPMPLRDDDHILSTAQQVHTDGGADALTTYWILSNGTYNGTHTVTRPSSKLWSLFKRYYQWLPFVIGINVAGWCWLLSCALEPRVGGRGAKAANGEQANTRNESLDSTDDDCIVRPPPVQHTAGGWRPDTV